MGYLMLALLAALGAPVSQQSSAWQPPCQALTYFGATSKDKIQAAINDSGCSVVELAAVGPDPSGAWVVSAEIYLRSNLVVQGPATGMKPTLLATPGFTGAGIFRGDNLSNVTITRLTMDGAGKARNAVWVRGGDHLSVLGNNIRNMSLHGVHCTTNPCRDLLVQANGFSAAGVVAVRVDPPGYHARVTVTRNSFSGSNYAVALAGCVSCVVSYNAIASPASSGVDFNRVYYSSITGNLLSGTLWRGITVDDSSFNTISGNIVPGTTDLGIAIANGEVLANKPWYVTNNVISGNTVTNSAGTALIDGAVNDPQDHNYSNTFSNNTISGNAIGCKQSVAVTNGTWFGNGPDPCVP